MALVPSLLWGTIEAAGPLACLMVHRLGLRITSLVGALVCAVAFTAASFTTEVWMLVLTFGVMAGECFHFTFILLLMSLCSLLNEMY